MNTFYWYTQEPSRYFYVSKDNDVVVAEITIENYYPRINFPGDEELGWNRTRENFDTELSVWSIEFKTPCIEDTEHFSTIGLNGAKAFIEKCVASAQPEEKLDE